MRLIILVLTLASAVGFGFAAENPEVTLPIDAQKALNVLSADINAAKQKGADELRKILVELGKKGDPATALLVKKTADDLDAEIQKSLTVDVLGNPIANDAPAASK